jgi:hypothetical protein
MLRFRAAANFMVRRSEHDHASELGRHQSGLLPVLD